MKPKNTTYEKATHHYFQPVTWPTALESVLTEYYQDVSWSLSPEGVHWPDELSAADEKEFNQYVEQAVIDGNRSEAQKVIENLTTGKETEISQGVNEYKVTSWAEKARRANALITQTVTDEELQIIQLECDARQRQETPKQLAQKQYQKSLNHAANMSLIDGYSKAAMDKITECQATDEMNQVIYELTQSFQTITR